MPERSYELRGEQAAFDFGKMEQFFIDEEPAWQRKSQSINQGLFVFEGRNAIESVGVSFRPSITPEVEQFLEQRQIMFAGTNETTSNEIRKVISKSIELGRSEPDTAIAIVEKFSALSLGRATTIARTESSTAMNFSGITGARQSGLVLDKQWLSSRDDDVRQPPLSSYNHLLADGERVAIDAKYTRTGEELDYPGDSSGSPGNIINCRCASRFINRR